MSIFSNRVFLKALAILLLGMGVSTVYGQNESKYKFNNITVENNLSHNTVSAVVKDDLGFIWIGTNDGLNRYDSKDNFTVYKANEPDIEGGLESSMVRTLFKDSKGLIWIAANGRLVCGSVLVANAI